jgi:predicted nucleic acid-binding protein
MSGRIRYQFDNCAAVDFIEAKQDGVNIWPADLEESERFASIITRMEFMSYPDMTEDDKAERLDFMSSIFVLPITIQIEKTAVLIRRTRRLKLPDAITAATAIISGSVLLTSDPHLLKLDWPGMETFNILR